LRSGPEGYKEQQALSSVQDEDREYTDRRVLVADDDAAVLEMIQEVIRRSLKCATDSARDGEETLRCLSDRAYDILLMDMMMPGPHGLEHVKRVRTGWPEVDIVIMTSYVDDFPYVLAIEAGASDIISKPHAPSELVAKLMRVLRERDLRAAREVAERKYRGLFQLSMIGMVLVEPESSHIIEANRMFCEMIGRPEDTLVGCSLLDLVNERERARLEMGLTAFSVSGKGVLGDLVLTRPDGVELSLDVSVSFVALADGAVVLLAFQDFTGRREIEQQLALVAQTDQLTGLANKYTFHTRLEGAIARAASEKTPLTLLALDLDNFKRCNDIYGHAKGDEVLVMTGDIIRKNTRAGADEGFRCGGDEFMVLLPGSPASVGERIAERMREDFEKADNYGVSLSVGIAEYVSGMRAHELAQTADEALYRAKAAGKNGIQVAL